MSLNDNEQRLLDGWAAIQRQHDDKMIWFDIGSFFLSRGERVSGRLKKFWKKDPASETVMKAMAASPRDCNIGRAEANLVIARMDLGDAQRQIERCESKLEQAKRLSDEETAANSSITIGEAFPNLFPR